LSVTDNGTPGAFTSNDAAVSANGQFVAFTSYAFDLTASDTNSSGDIFLSDRLNKHLVAVTVQTGSPIVLESDTIAENQGSLNVTGQVEAHNSLFIRNAPGLGDFISKGFNVADTAPTNI